MRTEAVSRACFPAVQINKKRTPLISRPSGNNPLGTAKHGRMCNSKLESLSMEFSRQEYWSRFPFHSLGYLPKTRIKSGSPALQADSFPSEPPGKPKMGEGEKIKEKKNPQTGKKQKDQNKSRNAKAYSIN